MDVWIGGRWPLLNASVRRGLRIRWRRRLSHLDRMRGSAPWEANGSRSSEKGNQDSKCHPNCLTLPFFPSVRPRLNSLKPITHEWAPGLDREISKTNPLVKDLERQEWMLRESRRNSLLFLFSQFSHTCRKPTQSYDQSSSRGHRSQQMPDSAGGSPCLIGGAAVPGGWQALLLCVSTCPPRPTLGGEHSPRSRTAEHQLSGQTTEQARLPSFREVTGRKVLGKVIP